MRGDPPVVRRAYVKSRTAAVAFPTLYAYRGEFRTIVPHLTVAQGDAAQAEIVGSLLKSRLTLGGGR
jgi:hypothetical protein